jgi:hypothetical protein
LIHDANIENVLLSRPRIAVVGASDKQGRPVDAVGRYLIEQGFEVLPVHPSRKEVWGLKTYPRLEEVPGPVDIVDLFRAPEHCPAHAREALGMDPPPMVFWMQQGIVSPQARAMLEPEGVMVVENECIMVEHRRLSP